MGTTGAWHVLSNNINSVPREARIEIDIRDIDLERRDAVVKSVHDKVKSVAEKRGVTYSIDMINQDPPATCADQARPIKTASATFFSCWEHCASDLYMLRLV